ncbi:ADP-ribosylation factor 2 [Eurytemora carolleeae]|uniref:ADP-ribosylation factor 2 n=1 Tax=Eurytemora carolleeae TaxID=1294199 RepID=UPI000C7948D2|nr:ADP-ribosylation factor 2 [Eurytemora carolleeae]|eukprot:XP_023332242.1 ADP-ribosylation factor 2-like [Eurytemora affinis]
MGLVSNVLDWILGPLPAKIILLGLDNAGKTTILYKIKQGQVINTIPTDGFNVNINTVTHKSVNFTVYDIGGQDSNRDLWYNYYEEVEAVVYVVDSSDKNRMEESKLLLESILRHELLYNCTLLVLNNKDDRLGTCSNEEVASQLGLNQFNDRDLTIQSTCALRGEGVWEGLDWLAKNIKKKKKRQLF